MGRLQASLQEYYLLKTDFTIAATVANATQHFHIRRAQDMAARPARVYTPEEKSTAMRRILVDGETPATVARAMDLNSNTVRSWIHDTKGTVARVTTSSHKERLAREVLEYCHAGLQSLRTQAELLGDRDFLSAKDSQVFAVAQANRLLGEQLARYITALQHDA